MEMSDTSGNNGDIEDSKGEREENEEGQRGNNGNIGGDGNGNDNEKSNKRVVMNDPKEMKHQEFTISHNQSMYTTVKGITMLKKM